MPKQSRISSILGRFRLDPSGCWIWTGATYWTGYGRVQYLGKEWSTHRLIYVLTFGGIPEGKQLDHLCRNRSCANPNHLRAVSVRENLLAEGSLSPAKRLSERNECSNGHPFNAGNTYLRKDGRRCRICQRKYEARYRQKSANA